MLSGTVKGIASPSKRKSGVQATEEIEALIDEYSPPLSAVISWRQDLSPMALLTALYFLQGIPLGLCGGSLPFLLKQRGFSYSALGIFSMATLPFSLKLLWSPFVDAYYVRSVGRRKSWIIPTQFLSGILLFYVATRIEHMVATSDVTSLTVVFFLLVGLFATQDIAVDGMALEILHSQNLPYAATCQSVGQNLGYFASFSGFLALSAFNVLDLPSFMVISGCCFIGGAGWLALGVSEKAPPAAQELEIGALYAQLWRIIQLPSVRKLSLFLLTVSVPLVASDRALHLRLMESGVTKELLASFSALAMPLSVFFAIITGRMARRGAPLSHGLRLGLFIRILASCGGMAMLPFLSGEPVGSGKVFLLFCLFVLGTFGSSLTFVSSCAFFNVVSDPLMGGSYLTLLNTVANLGRAWAVPLVLGLIDMFGFVPVNSFSLLCAMVYISAIPVVLRQLEATPQSEWFAENGSLRKPGTV